MRKVMVVTGSRAEYGLFTPLLRQLQRDPEFELQLVVTGMHLSPEFGLTCREIVRDGFPIADQVEMLVSSDTPTGIAKSVGLGVIGFADTIRRLQPDLLIVLGDRFETFAAAQAALFANVPIAHIHGGERTEGQIDEAIRHAITKMAHLHFVSTEEYRRRVIQLGEQPDRVFHVGALGIDVIRNTNFLSREELEQSLSFRFGKINFLVTYHPVTLSYERNEEDMRQLIDALDHFPDAHIIFTKPNADTNGRVIGEMIDQYVAGNKERTAAYTSLGQLRYLSLLNEVDVVIGNSSSGIIEVPYFRKPTVNIGDRQKGRAHGPTVISCGNGSMQIIRAIEQALSEEFKKKIQHAVSIYGDGHAASKIVEILRTTDFKSLIVKSFYDVRIHGNPGS